MDMKKLKEILSQYNFIYYALLFGSYAKGEERYLSDIDIAIETRGELELLTYGDLVVTLEEFCGRKVDLVISNELYKTNPKMAFNITNNHKVLVLKDENRYIDFKANSLKYYFDTVHMYKMFDKSLQERLENGTFGKVKAS